MSASTVQAGLQDVRELAARNVIVAAGDAKSVATAADGVRGRGVEQRGDREQLRNGELRGQSQCVDPIDKAEVIQRQCLVGKPEKRSQVGPRDAKRGLQRLAWSLSTVSPIAPPVGRLTRSGSGATQVTVGFR